MLVVTVLLIMYKMEIPLSSCLDTSQILSSAKYGLERFLRIAATSWFYNVLFLLSNKFGLGLTVACLGVYGEPAARLS